MSENLLVSADAAVNGDSHKGALFKNLMFRERVENDGFPPWENDGDLCTPRRIHDGAHAGECSLRAGYIGLDSRDN